MPTWADIHSFTTHFLIAPYLISFGLDLFAILKNSRRHHSFAWILLTISAAASALALVSGLTTKNILQLGEAASKNLELHETTAFIVVGGILSLFLWRLGLKGSYPEQNKFIYLIISAIIMLAVIAGAYFGGELAHSF